ncbi:hypothetical protein DFJ77DRAFT_505711 [Powellomyces hirtus]|nr:hypothetical protein DFJ77DRAFT_505711 [Powellomyces hirtus]
MTDTKTATNVEEGNVVHTTKTKTKSGFWTRPKKIIAGIVVFIVLFLIIFLPILFFVIVPKIAQKGINSSVLTFKSADITNPRNGTFDLAMKIDVTEAGHTKATITHTSPMTVYWITPTTGEIPFLRMELPPFSVDGGDGTIDASVKGVTVLNEGVLTKFNQFLITQDSFQWRLVGEVSARALGRDYGGLTMSKVVTLGGMKGLKGTTIKEFDVKLGPNSNTTATPMQLNATLINPSPIGLELGVMVFNVSTTSGIPLGTASTRGISLVRSGGAESTLILDGLLNPTAALPEAAIELLKAVLAGTVNLPVNVVPVSIGGNDPVSWISGALVGAPLPATFGKKPVPAGEAAAEPAAHSG